MRDSKRGGCCALVLLNDCMIQISHATEVESLLGGVKAASRGGDL